MFQLNFFLRRKKIHQQKNNLVSRLCSKSISWLILSQINSDIFSVAEAKQGCTVIVKCFWNLYNENNCIHFRHVGQAEIKIIFLQNVRRWNKYQEKYIQVSQIRTKSKLILFLQRCQRIYESEFDDELITRFSNFGSLWKVNFSFWETNFK